MMDGFGQWFQQAEDGAVDVVVEHLNQIPGFGWLDPAEQEILKTVMKRIFQEDERLFWQMLNELRWILENPVQALRMLLEKLFRPYREHLQEVQRHYQAMTEILHTSHAGVQQIVEAGLNGMQAHSLEQILDILPLFAANADFFASPGEELAQGVSEVLVGIDLAIDEVIEFAEREQVVALLTALLESITSALDVTGIEAPIDLVAKALLVVGLAFLTYNALVEIKKGGGQIINATDRFLQKPPNDPGDFLKTLIKVLLTGAGIGLAGLTGVAGWEWWKSESTPAKSTGTSPSNAVASPTPIPLIQYPPSVAGDLYREAMYAFLFLTQGAGAANQFASSGAWPADASVIDARLRRIVAQWPSAPPIDIALLLQANCTDAQIDRFLQRVSDAQKNGMDVYGLTAGQLQALLQQVISKFMYNDPKDPKQTLDRHFEAEILQKLLPYLEGIEIPYINPAGGLITEIDGVTAHALIEITRGDGGDKLRQFTKYWAADLAKYGSTPRPIIVFGPNINTATTYQMIQQANALAGNGPVIPIYVITNGGICTNDSLLQEKLAKLGIDIPIYGITADGKWTNVTYPANNEYKPIPAQVPANVSLNDILRMFGMPI